MPRKCIAEGCQTQAFFGDPVSLKRTHCKKHMLDGMVDVMNKKCSVCRDKRPTFGLERGKSATHCAKCRTDQMFDVVSKMCAVCHKKQPKFGLERGKPATHCAKCKTDQMLNVMDKMCTVCGKKIPVFGLDRSKAATHCGSCKTDQMFDVMNKMCTVCGKTRPKFGLERGKPATHCKKCKKLHMVDVKNPVCKSEHCETRSNPEYDWYCTHCFQNLFPFDERTQNIRAKTREIAVRDFLVTRYGDMFVHNQSLFTSCDCDHRRSVDFRRIIGCTMLAVEVDEGQHKGKSYRTDTEARYNDLAMAFGGKWVFIRFNPDSYVDADGKRVMGFFDSKGAKRTDEMSRRLDELARCIDEQTKRIERDENVDLLEEVFLFYDV